MNLGSPIPSGGRYRPGIPNIPILPDATNFTPELWQEMGGAGKRAGVIDEISDTKMAALKDTQTIHLEIKRAAYITLDDKGTGITSKCNQLIQHIELTKNSDDEFIFGNSTNFIESVKTSFAYDPLNTSTGQHSEQFW